MGKPQRRYQVDAGVTGDPGSSKKCRLPDVLARAWLRTFCCEPPWAKSAKQRQGRAQLQAACRKIGHLSIQGVDPLGKSPYRCTGECGVRKVLQNKINC